MFSGIASRCPDAPAESGKPPFTIDKSYYPLIQFLAFFSVQISRPLSCWSQATGQSSSPFMCSPDCCIKGRTNRRVGGISFRLDGKGEKRSARSDRTFLIFYLDTFMKVLGQHQPPGELRCCLASILQISHIPPSGVWRAQFNIS